MSMVADISVIIPCYRCSETIERAMKSALSQTLKPAEIILIEDHSDDDNKTLNTLEKLRDSEKNIPIKILTHSLNRGPGAARNRGWESSSCSYVSFLDADDSWHPKKLEIQFGWLQQHPSVDFCGHQMLYLKSNQVPETLPPLKATAITLDCLLLSNCLPTPSVIMKKSLPFRFNEDMRQAEDYLLWLNIIHEGYSVFLLEMPLAYVHKELYGASGLSSEMWSSHKNVLLAYKQLRMGGFIAAPRHGFLIIYSYIKFYRRLLVLLSRLVFG